MDILRIIKELKMKHPALQDDETMDKLEAALPESSPMGEEEGIEAPMDIRNPEMEGPPAEEMGEGYEDVPEPTDVELSIGLVGEEDGMMPEDMDEEAPPMHAKKMKRKGGPNLANLKRK